MTIIKSFLRYQSERFPLIILIPVSLCGVIGASAVLGRHNWVTITLSTCLTVAFLFHIRVIDEIRDFSHDNAFHPERPIQKQIITLRELKMLRTVSLVVFFGASLMSVKTVIVAAAVFLYSSLAGRDFFCPERIRKHFYLYNFLNMIQLIGLQLVVYSMFGWTFWLSNLIIFHIFMVFLLSLLLEVARKIKLSKNETLGKDTYSYHLGYRGSIAFFAAVLLAAAFPVGIIIWFHAGYGALVWLFIFCLLGLGVSGLQLLEQRLNPEKTLPLLSVVFYLAANIILYLSLK